MSDEQTTRKVFTEDERVVVTKAIAQAINEAAIPGIKAQEVDYVIAKGAHKGKKSIIAWVELEGKRILGYKVNAKGFINLSYAMEGVTEETLEEVGLVVAGILKLQKPILPDDYTNWETEFKKPDRKNFGPRINVEELQAKLTGKRVA